MKLRHTNYYCINFRKYSCFIDDEKSIIYHVNVMKAISRTWFRYWRQLISEKAMPAAANVTYGTAEFPQPASCHSPTQGRPNSSAVGRSELQGSILESKLKHQLYFNWSGIK